MLAAIAPGGIAFPANNLSAFSSDVKGVFAGTANEIATSGPQTVQFTTAGGRPRNGALVWLANLTDDGDTGAGKATAIDPTNGFGLFNSLQSNRVPVGTVLDNSRYYIDGTCIIDFAPANAEATAPSQPPDQIFNGAEDVFPTNADFLALSLSVGGNLPFATLHDGESMVICWDIVDTTALPGGVGFIAGATNPGFTEGWYLDYLGGTYYFAINTSGGPGFVSFPIAALGLDCVAVTVTGGNLR